MTAAETLIRRESRVAARNYAPLPVVLAAARGEWLTDVDGRRYLDMMSAYSAVSHGHAHPRLVAALVEQAGKVAVTSRAYHNEALAPFLEKLTAVAGLDRALPANGGAESVETAIKAARRWGYRVKGIAPERATIAVARGNFHGRSTTIVGFSTEAAYRADFGPFAPGFVHFDFGDIGSLAAAVGENTCAVLIEPIQGEAGIIVPPPGFLRAARSLCNECRILLIADEIQSGLGRTGRWFACQHEGIRPDGLIVGKALGGGLLPVSALVGTAELMDVFDPGSHGSTFGGNPLAARVALEALRVIDDENLVARSAALGAHLLARLRAIDSPLVREVRGRGLWVGVDLDPSLVAARDVVLRLMQRGVLSKETHDTVIRFAPPLTIERQAIDWGVDVFAEVLRESARRPTPVRARPTADAATRRAPPRPQARLMMCAPDFFEVSYRINPWMEPDRWQRSARRLSLDATRGWQRLKATYERLGAEVVVQPPQQGLPDMVFTANAAMVLDRKVLLARFACAERRGEEAHDRDFFEELRVRGLIDEIIEPPPGLAFEGAGDAVWDAHRGLAWIGWGQRSSRGIDRVIADVYSVPAVSLELVDPRFYHLDTCFCVLSGGEIIVHPPALTAASLAKLRELVDPSLLIEADGDDARHLAVNSVCLGRDVVLCHASPHLRGQLEERDYRAHVVPLDSFNRSGGAAYCLTLRLDLSSTAKEEASAADGRERRAA
jgi:ornithine aminotransferase